MTYQEDETEQLEDEIRKVDGVVDVSVEDHTMLGWCENVESLDLFVGVYARGSKLDVETIINLIKPYAQGYDDVTLEVSYCVKGDE
jgi:type III secretory pathway lipoprotein EscJ